MPEPIQVIGGGLAGVEAAWQIAKAGLPVTLHEMRPVRQTPAHKTAYLAELVCSNSLRADDLATAVGLLKAEMRRMGSIILAVADRVRVEAGGALAVGRDVFAREVTAELEAAANVTIVRNEIERIPTQGLRVIATGPLTSDALAEDIRRFTGAESLHFYDALAPIVETSSLDPSLMFWASRYGKGGGADYANSPLDAAGYQSFVEMLLAAELAPLHSFEEPRYFERCLPIEEMARRGVETLRFGPMKPVGLPDPRTGRIPYAVVQLRRDTLAGDHMNLVGFQSRMKWPEQERIFRTLPGLAEARFVRLGQVHRNTYVDAPRVLLPTWQTRSDPRLFFAGQLAGVEGYVESAASGLLAGRNAARLAQGSPALELPRETMMGALAWYISHIEPEHFSPAKAAFGYLPEPPRLRRKRDRRAAYAPRALASLDDFLAATASERIPA